MKKLIKVLILLLALVYTAFSCDDESETQPEEIPFSKVKGLSLCGDSCFLKNTEYKNEFYVINSQGEYNLLFECSLNYELTEIDFNLYTLLAGSQAINGICPTILYESVKKNTETKIISYEIGIKEGGYPALGSAYFHALIPKIGNEYSVEVDVQTEPFINNK